MKRIIGFFIALFIFVGTLPIGVFAEGELKWEDRESRFKVPGTEWSFRPPKDYMGEQNPPDFSWPVVNSADEYELKICKDKALTDIAYEQKGIKNNFYNFPYIFTEGIYYWSVRFIKNGIYSEWTEPSRFNIMPGASEFPVMDIDAAIKKLPQSHPRWLVNKETLPRFKEIAKGEAKEIYDAYRALVDKDMENPLPDEPESVSALRSACLGYAYLIQRLALVYLVEDNEEVGKKGVEALLKLASWDPNGITSYANQDQAFRDLIKGLTYGYDYLYELMTTEQRKTVLAALQKRISILEHPTEGLVGDAAYNLPESPFQSHGFTAIHYLLAASFVTLGEIPEAEEYIRKYLMLYINILPPWGNEDGGWSQGVSYAGVSLYEESEIPYQLYINGICNMYNKAFMKNMYKYPLYNLGTTTGALWGDGSLGVTDGNWSLCLNLMKQAGQSGYITWLMDKFGSSLMTYFSVYYLHMFPEPEIKEPIDLPRSLYLKDLGWVTMHSDLTDLNGRTSFYFKSSPYGSYNHSHNDQNGFTVSAYGETLATNSGYYDAMWSDYFNNYYKTTYAHNCITLDGGQGQLANSKKANGDIVNYLTHPYFDLASGDATDAYYYNPQIGSDISRMKRHIIYIRPETFIIVDDLKTDNGKKSSFEWWINAIDSISLYNSKKGGRIEKGNAALDFKIQYPEKVKATYSDIFAGPDMVAWTPGGSYSTDKVHKKIWFSTEKTEGTKIITTMATHKKEEEAPYVKSETIGNVVKLEFEDGTISYIRTDDGEIDIDGIKTDGLAVTVKKDTIMAVDATTLTRNEKLIYKSEKPISMVFGVSELGISAYEDTKAEFYIGKVDEIKNEKGIEVLRNNSAYGVTWEDCEGGIKTDILKGCYSYYINGKLLPGSPAEDEKMLYSLDGKEEEITVKGYYNHDGRKILSGNIVNEAGFYTIEDLKDVNIKGNAKKGEFVLLGKNEGIYAYSNDSYLKIKSAASGEPLFGNKIDNPDEYKKKCTATVEAENYFIKSGGGNAYTSRSFLSGGAGLTGFNVFGDLIEWRINVPAEDDYDIVIKYVGWEGTDGYIKRVYNINGNIGVANLPVTNNYGQLETEWISSRLETKVHLNKGENSLILYPQSGSWNVDYISIIPSNK